MEPWWAVLQGPGSFHISLPCFVIKSHLAGGWWVLVNPLARSLQGAFPLNSPAPSLPPATRMLWVRGQPDQSRCSALHLAVNWSLPNCVPNSGTFLTPLLVPALPSLWTVFLQEDHLIRPTPPSVSPTVTFMWLLAS